MGVQGARMIDLFGGFMVAQNSFQHVMREISLGISLKYRVGVYSWASCLICFPNLRFFPSDLLKHAFLKN